MRIAGSEKIAVKSPVLNKSIDMPINSEDEKKTNATTSSGSKILFLLSLGILFIAYYLNLRNDPNPPLSYNNNLDKTAEESRKTGQMAEMLVTY